MRWSSNWSNPTAAAGIVAPMHSYLTALVLMASPLLAQQSEKKAPVAPDTSHDDAAEVRPFPLQFGVAGGALSYEGGRSEQTLGAVVRWVTTPWLSLSATPTVVRVREPSATVVGASQRRDR